MSGPDGAVVFDQLQVSAVPPRPSMGSNTAYWNQLYVSQLLPALQPGTFESRKVRGVGWGGGWGGWGERGTGASLERPSRPYVRFRSPSPPLAPALGTNNRSPRPSLSQAFLSMSSVSTVITSTYAPYDQLEVSVPLDIAADCLATVSNAVYGPQVWVCSSVGRWRGGGAGGVGAPVLCV